jgi:citrate synthase
MRIGKQDQPYTAIATSDDRSITVRGHDLVGDLIGRVDFTAYLWLLVCGAPPTAAQRAALDACLVAIAEHGLVPSVQAARMTLAAAPEAWQGAMAAGLLGMGSVVAGSTEVAGRFLAEVVAAGGDAAAARAALERVRAARAKVPGLGHPQHSAGDPRADRLMALADELGLSGAHVAALRHLGALAPEVMGRALPVNVSGAIPALMLDAGWPLAALKAVPLVARAGGLSAHLFEESQRPIGFILSHNADLAITYDGERAE